MSRRFCVRCGVLEGSDRPIIDGLCPKCFTKERSIVNLPSKIEITVCSSCYALYFMGKWVNAGLRLDEILEYYINNALMKRENVYPGFRDVRAQVIRIGGGKVEVIVKGTYRGVTLSQRMITDVRVTYRLCPRCLKIKTGGYEALIQIRFEGGVDKSLGKEVLEFVSRYERVMNAIIDIEEVKEGLNIKLMSHGVARQIANIIRKKFGAKVVYSWTNTGYVSGRRHSKLTISLRLPTLRRCDVVLVSEKDIALVTDVNESYVKLLRLSDGKEVKLSYDNLWSKGFRKLTSKEYVIIKGKVLGYEGGYAVIQEITSGSIYRVKPHKLKDPGSDAEVLIYKGEVYLLR